MWRLEIKFQGDKKLAECISKETGAMTIYSESSGDIWIKSDRNPATLLMDISQAINSGKGQSNGRER